MAVVQDLPYVRPASSFRTMPDMWNHRVGSTPDLVAMWTRRDGRWLPVTWRQAHDRVSAIAHGLLARGLEPEQRCAILATTSVDWIVADLGILCAAGATTTIYPTEPGEECAFILRDAGVTWLFCEDDDQVAKILEHRDTLPELKGIVVFRGGPSDDGFVTRLDALEAEGTAHAASHPDALDLAQEALTPDSLATLIYTSGTTGRPKGVRLTHDAWVYEAEAIDQLRQVGPDDVQLLFLPLAHVFAKVMQVTFIRLGVPTAVDGSADRFLDNVAEVRPTWMAAVPRVFEKAYNRIVAEARDRGTISWLAFRWAVDVGREASRRRRAGRALPPPLLLQHAVADRLVLSHVREAFGGRLRFLISGGAPLPIEVAEFFDACGILICEGYGLTESAAASCVNTPDDVRFGTVGRPLAGCEVRIADDGEILLRSRGVMQGYHELPDETHAALDDDGWLHTGDIGRILDTGHVQITDRKKDLIVTASGKNVAPAAVEARLKARTPFVAHALVHGDRRNFCSALISLELDTVTRWATSEGISWSAPSDLARHPDVRAVVQQAIDDVNKELASYEHLRRFAIVPEPFSIEDGTLTPSLKVKRRVVEARYAEILDRFYEGTVAKL